MKAAELLLHPITGFGKYKARDGHVVCFSNEINYEGAEDRFGQSERLIRGVIEAEGKNAEMLWYGDGSFLGTSYSPDALDIVALIEHTPAVTAEAAPEPLFLPEPALAGETPDSKKSKLRGHPRWLDIAVTVAANYASMGGNHELIPERAAFIADRLVELKEEV